MPEPGPNCVDVDARLQQVRGGRMANDVGTDPLCLESRRGGTQLRDVPLDQCVNAVTREGLATTVQKQMRLVGTLPCEATKLLDGFGPERATTLLLPLASHGVFPVKLIRLRRSLACHPRSGAKRSGAGSEATLTRQRPDTLSRASAPLRALGCLCGLCRAHSFWHCASPFAFGSEA